MTRAEALAAKKKKKKTTREEAPSEAKPKDSAADRTLPIPGTEGKVHCGTCNTTSDLKDCSKRPSGELECPTCAAPIKPSDLPKGMAKAIDQGVQTSVTSDPPRKLTNDERPPKATQPLPKMYCNICGAHWERVDGTPFPNCGHDDGMVDDPRKAKKWNPPAGHPRPDASILPPLVSPPLHPLSNAPASRSDDVHLRVEWGKAVFNMGDYTSLTVGPASISTNIPAEDVVQNPLLMKEIGKMLTQQLRDIADDMYREQMAWFEKKLKEGTGRR